MADGPILVTGAAGFIGFHVAQRLLRDGRDVIGLDNMNAYYDPTLKEARRAELAKSNRFQFVKLDLADREGIAALFKEHRFPYVVHLAAQAGVRYSLVDPFAYVDANLTGFTTILEGCRHNGCRHLLYASSSSVYGSNTKMPFSVHDNVDHPLSLYGASKKANELMSHAYAHLFGLPMTGLRFFTVYGPWGRPDMAMWIFAKAISAGEPIKLFNNGNMRRDFTYIDDLVQGMSLVIESPAARNQIFNLTYGSSRSISDLLDIMREHFPHVEVERVERDKLMPFRGTLSVERAVRLLGYAPKNPIEIGFPKYIEWYRDLYRQSPAAVAGAIA
jgi:UDP-glucuronate 4-epimerase